MTIFSPNFESLFVYSLIASVLAVVLFLLPLGLAPKFFSAEKLSAYECGFEPFAAPHEVFESHFIIVAVLFIIFDLEMIFLFPWAATAGLSGKEGFFAILAFLGLLGLGLAYEWARGALTWPIFFLFKKKYFF